MYTVILIMMDIIMAPEQRFATGLSSIYLVIFFCVNYLLCLYFVCTLSVLCLYFVCTLSVLCLYFVCTLSVLCLYFVCTLSVLCLYFVCTLSVLCLYFVCTLSVLVYSLFLNRLFYTCGLITFLWKSIPLICCSL